MERRQWTLHTFFTWNKKHPNILSYFQIPLITTCPDFGPGVISIHFPFLFFMSPYCRIRFKQYNFFAGCSYVFLFSFSTDEGSKLTSGLDFKRRKVRFWRVKSFVLRLACITLELVVLTPGLPASHFFGQGLTPAGLMSGYSYIKSPWLNMPTNKTSKKNTKLNW